MKQHTIVQVCECMKKFWNDLRPEVIVKSFKKLGINNALDSTDDGALFEVTDSGSRKKKLGFEYEDSSGYEHEVLPHFSMCPLFMFKSFLHM